jgi:hypothetical protein
MHGQRVAVPLIQSLWQFIFCLLQLQIYFALGDSFVHLGTPAKSPPTYLDPERLLSEGTVDPYIPYNR